MPKLTDALHLIRPVYWGLPEAPYAAGIPGETLTVDIGPDRFRDLGYGVFFCPNELGDVKNKNGNLRHDKNIRRYAALFVDLDDGTPDEQRARLNGFHLPPSAIVRTARGHHAYWFLDYLDEITPEAWRRTQQGLAATLGGDPACVDPARLMRLPGYYHVKHEPFLVEIIHLNEHWTYLLDQFSNEMAPKTNVFYLSSTSGNRTRRLVNAPRPPVVTVIEPGGRHRALLEAAARYLRGVSPSEIHERAENLKAWYAQSCTELKPHWEKEVDDIVSWLTTKELGNYL